VPQGEDPAIRA